MKNTTLAEKLLKLKFLLICTISQAGLEGLIMASAVVVLKHEISTLRQSHNFLSIDLRIGVGDYVREVTSPAKFG